MPRTAHGSRRMASATRREAPERVGKRCSMMVRQSTERYLATLSIVDVTYWCQNRSSRCCRPQELPHSTLPAQTVKRCGGGFRVVGQELREGRGVTARFSTSIVQRPTTKDPSTLHSQP